MCIRDRYQRRVRGPRASAMSEGGRDRRKRNRSFSSGSRSRSPPNWKRRGDAPAGRRRYSHSPRRSSPPRRQRSRSRGGSFSPRRRSPSPRRSRSPRRRRSPSPGADRGQTEDRKFFEQHKGEEWFSEKYDPNLAEQRRGELISLAQKNAEEFASKLQAGELNPCYDFVEDGEPKPEGKNDDGAEANAEEAGKTDGEQGTSGEGVDASTTIFVKSVPPSLKKAQLLEFLKPAALKFSDPIPSKDWARNAWASYDDSESCTAAYNRCKADELEGVSLDLALTPPNRMRNGPARPRIMNRSFADERRIAHDLEQARQLVQHLDAEKDLVPNEALTTNQGDSASADLDLLLLYLKQVHLFDYYAGEDFLSEAEMEQRSPGGWLRGRAPDREVENRTITKQEVALDQKIKQRLSTKWVLDARIIGDKMAEFEKKFLDEHTLKVEEGKYGCSFSTKLFMAKEFVHKHIVNKHSAKLEEGKEAEIERLYWDCLLYTSPSPRDS
eukprot:TRINITY_DN15691_c0_g1_i1.p1 TRINITY_DN15691_c0_g1~~TRINITY_DN15691_c0_g1_i1.p1  ORF type:complete len:497 (+),score=128.87 TRINITY_DN15691_c0_g1_i1:136-1626(+)